MGVRVRRERDRAVSEEFHDHPKMDAFGKQEARGRMSKIVKPRLRGYFGGPQQALEVAV